MIFNQMLTAAASMMIGEYSQTSTVLLLLNTYLSTIRGKTRCVIWKQQWERRGGEGRQRQREMWELEIKQPSDKKNDQCVWVEEVYTPPMNLHVWAVCGDLMERQRKRMGVVMAAERVILKSEWHKWDAKEWAGFRSGSGNHRSRRDRS